jgi:aminopeptidase N
MKYLTILFLLASFAMAQTDEPKPTEHSTRNRTYHVSNYKLKLSVDVKDKTCAGTATIALSPLRSQLDTVALDAGDMEIKSVTVDGKKQEFHTIAETLFVALDKPCKYGEMTTVAVDYSIKNPKKGMYFTAADSGYPERQWEAWTQGEAEDNHFWFPCYDYPNDKSTSEIIATVDDKFIAISNGKLLGVTADKKNHTKTFDWKESKPHVSYLISLIVGDYVDVHDSYKGLSISNYVYKFQKDIAKYSFGKTPKMIGFFSDKIGYPYPWEKFAQTVVQDFIFGGEENVSAVTLNDYTIHDARAHLEYDSDGLVSHELAHMWWGDLLTCRSWSHAWLNEGFATYFEMLFTEYDKGRDDFGKELHDNQTSLIVSDVGDHRKATVSGMYVHPIELFGNRIYQKGACVLEMLRSYLGEGLFWKSINYYAHKHAFQNVETNDFKIAIEEATGYNLDWFFNQWVYKPGYPEFNVSWSWDADAKLIRMYVGQTQQLDSLTGLFIVPLDVQVWVNDKPATYRVTVSKLADTLTFPAETQPQLVIFDKGGEILKKVTFKKPASEWVYQLQHAQDGTDRSAALTELRNMLDSSGVKAAVTHTMLHDTFWDVRRTATNAVSDSHEDSAAQYLMTAYSDHDAKVRESVVQLLRNYNSPEVVSLLKSAFENDSSYSVEATALGSLTKLDSSHAREYALQALKMNSYRESIRGGGLRVLADIGDDSSYAIIKQYTAYGMPRELRLSAMRLLGRTWKERDEVVDIMIGLLHDRSVPVKRSAIDILGTLGNKKAIEPLQQISANETDDRIVRMAKSSIEKIQKSDSDENTK